jgi:hypothetical protein
MRMIPYLLNFCKANPPPGIGFQLFALPVVGKYGGCPCFTCFTNITVIPLVSKQEGIPRGIVALVVIVPTLQRGNATLYAPAFYF